MFCSRQKNYDRSDNVTDASCKLNPFYILLNIFSSIFANIILELPPLLHKNNATLNPFWQNQMGKKIF